MDARAYEWPPVPWVRMATLEELALVHTPVKGDALAHLQRLALSWRLLADLSFADLLLLAPIANEDGHRFVVLAQVRPDHRPDALRHRPRRPRRRRGRAPARDPGVAPGGGDRGRGRTCSAARSGCGCSASRCGYRGREIAIVTREAPTTSGRRPGELERYYLEAFDRLARMVTEGSFPFAREEIELEGAPRVGDGVILLDADAAHPVREPELGELAAPHGHPRLHLGRAPRRDRLRRGRGRHRGPGPDAGHRGGRARRRVDPAAGDPAARGPQARRARSILLRDVTDLRRRDRMLMSKDATIREIHHRVKNNLQTIAALLRLQGRRLDSPEARQAIKESERRIRSIAIVHETLSREAREEVEFSDIVKPLVRVVEETVSTERRRRPLRGRGRRRRAARARWRPRSRSCSTS